MKIINPYRFGGSFSDPSDVAGLVLWLDAEDTSTLFQDAAKTTPVTTADDLVGCWEDKSGQGNDWTAASTDRPKFKTNFNTSYQALMFYEGGVTRNALSGSMAESANDWTAFFIVRPADASNRYYMDFATGRLIFGQAGSAAGFSLYDGDWFNDGTTITTSNYLVIYKLNSSGTSATITNNGSESSAFVYTQKALGGATQKIGSKHDAIIQSTYSGHIASILIYSGNLSSEDITSVESYLKTRYGLSY